MKNKKIILSIITAVGILIIWSIVAFITNKPSKIPTESEGENMGNISKPSTIIENTKFSIIDFGDAVDKTMVGKLDKINEEARKNEKQLIEILKLTETSKVHPVTKHKIYEDTSGTEYILSGEMLYLLDGNKILFSEEGGCNFLKDVNGNRLRVYCFESEAEMFKKAWEDGQAILQGKVPSHEGQVIIDGALSNITFTRKGEDIYIDLEKLQRWLNPDNQYKWEEKALVLSLSENYSVFLYNTLIEGEFLEPLKPFNDGTYLFPAPIDNVSIRIPLINAKKPTISLHDLSKISGADISTDGKAISIVTAPENITDKTLVFNPENKPLKIKIQRNQDNSLSYVKLDRFENIVESWAYDGEDDEMMQAMYPKH